MKTKIKLLLFAAVAFAFLGFYFSSRSSCAAGLVPCTNDCNLCYLIVGISNIFQYLTGTLLAVTVILGITIAGLSYIISGAFPKALTFAKSAIENTAKGAILALIAWLIINGIMNIVGYKHPTGGNWWQFECSGGSAQVANNTNNKTVCDSKNKKLESITIQCAEQKETLVDNGSGFFVVLGTLSEDEKGKTKQLKAIAKYSCDGTTSEEDMTAQAEWKASDETQIKVAKGLVQAVTTSLGSSSESVPYVEAKFQDKNSNQAKVYINSCPNAATAESATNDKFSFLKNSLTIPKANAQANANCKSCGQANTCHFIYGNKNAKNIIIFRMADNGFGCNNLKPWKIGDTQQLKMFQDSVMEYAKGLDYTANKDAFAIYRSDLVSGTDQSCPSGNSVGFAYFLNGNGFGRAEAGAINKQYTVYCILDRQRAPYLFAHEHIGHVFGLLDDEYIEGNTMGGGSSAHYNCTKKEKTSPLMMGFGGYDTKWGKLTEIGKGCFYQEQFMHPSKSSIMGEQMTSFGEINEKIIKYRADNYPEGEPPEWRETF